MEEEESGGEESKESLTCGGCVKEGLSGFEESVDEVTGEPLEEECRDRVC